jgi:hypothetical protein
MKPVNSGEHWHRGHLRAAIFILWFLFIFGLKQQGWISIASE